MKYEVDINDWFKHRVPQNGRRIWDFR
jgi:hypothetical protein